MKTILIKALLTVLPILPMCFLTVSKAEARNINLNCNSKSLQDTVNRAKPGDTINVSGTCYELVTIIVDNLIIDGGGTAVVDGTGVGGTGALLLIRASNITIKGITVQNGPSHGIAIRRSGSAVIENTIVMNNARHGISVTQSSFAEIGGGTDNPPTLGSVGNSISGNGQQGVNVRHGSGAHIFHNNIFNNGRSGIALNEDGSADIDGNSITGNTQRGISLQTNASVRLSGHPAHGEMNLIEENTQGVRCKTGGALRGVPQNFGTGNPGGSHTDDTNIDGSCSVDVSLAFP